MGSIAPDDSFRRAAPTFKSEQLIGGRFPNAARVRPRCLTRILVRASPCPPLPGPLSSRRSSRNRLNRKGRPCYSPRRSATRSVSKTCPHDNADGRPTLAARDVDGCGHPDPGLGAVPPSPAGLGPHRRDDLACGDDGQGSRHPGSDAPTAYGRHTGELEAHRSLTPARGVSFEQGRKAIFRDYELCWDH